MQEKGPSVDSVSLVSGSRRRHSPAMLRFSSRIQRIDLPRDLLLSEYFTERVMKSPQATLCVSHAGSQRVAPPCDGTTRPRRLSLLHRGLAKPRLKVNLAKPGAIVGNQRALAQLRAEVACVRVSHNLA